MISMKYKYEKEIETMSARFLKHLEDQKKKSLDERNNAIEQSNKEISLKMILQESEKQQIINEYEHILNKERKRVREECEIELKNCKQKMTKESEETIKSLQKELELSAKSFNALSEINTNEKKMMHDLYERNLSSKENLLVSMSTRLEDMFTIFQSFKSPVSKGQFGEKFMQSYLQKQFPTAEIQDTTHTPHSGDCIVSMKGINIMIEMKNKNTITRDDIKKFENDIDLHRHEFHGAIFLSSTHGIPNKGEFVFELYGNTPVLYISQFIESPVLLNVSLNVLFDFIPLLHQFQKDNNDSIEYENMIQTLTSIITTVLVLCDTLKQNCKTLSVIAQNVLEQKRKTKKKYSLVYMKSHF